MLSNRLLQKNILIILNKNIYKKIDNRKNFFIPL